MDNIHKSFDENFKSLWGKASPVYIEWEKMEILYSTLEIIANNLAIRHSEFKDITEIEKELKDNQQHIDELILESILYWWNRILLRNCLKVRDALQLLFYSSNSGNAYGCALAARSIIEHVALLQFLVKEIPWKNTSKIKQQELIEFTKQIYNLTQGSTFDWDKLLLENLSIRKILATKNWKRPKNDRIPQITNLVDALDKELSSHQTQNAEGYIQFLYSALCDVVHPSWGGEFIYASQMHQNMKADQLFDEQFKKIAIFFCLPILEVIKHFTVIIETMMNNEPKTLFGMSEK